MSLEILIRRPAEPPLVRDYHALEPRLAPFFPGSPWDPAAHRRRAQALRTRFPREAREAVARALSPSGPAGEERVARFLSQGGVVVTAGQQPGLFAGPLYTLHKALTAVRLASALEEVVGVPVLPLFWIASEDHDWEEVATATLLDPGNELREVALEAPGPRRAPIHALPVGEEVEAALDAFAALLPASEFRDGYLALLREAYRPGRTLSEAFRRVILRLLEPFPVAVLDGAHPAVKEASLPVLLRELEAAREHEEALREGTRRLVEAGYHAQVPILEGAVNLFVDGPQGRERLLREDGGFRLRGSGRRHGARELAERLQREPGRFSPNVLLRPVVENAVLPVVATVAGPGEVGYYAQLGGLFRAHGVSMPLVYPRPTVVVVEGKVRKVLEKFGLEIEELRGPLDALHARIAREALPQGVQEALEALRGAVSQGAERLLAEARGIDPTLEGPVGRARNAALSAFRDAETRILRAVRRRNETALAQLEKARRHLYPGGKPQERVLNPFYYLVRYGPPFLEALAAALPVDLETGPGRPLPPRGGDP